MPAQTGSRTPQAVLDASIHACEKQIAGSDFYKRALVCLSVGLLIVLALVIADHTWPGGLPRALASGAFLIAVAGVAAALLLCAAWLLFRRLNPLFAAQRLEQSLGVRHNTVVNALLLRRRKNVAQVIDAVTRRAALDVIQGDYVHGVGTPDRRPHILLAVTCGLWLLYLLLAPKSVFQSISRLFGSSAAAPTITQLEWLEPNSDHIVYAGEPLTIRVRVSGGLPEAVTFLVAPSVTDASAPPIRYEMHRASDVGAGSIWKLALVPSEVVVDIHYTCRAGDATLAGVIEVHPQPEILGYVIQLSPPKYVGGDVETVSDPDLLVWPGTTVTIEAQANVNVLNPVFVLAGEAESRTRMRIDPSRPMRMTVTHRLLRSGRYRIEFSDQWGHNQRNPDWHQIALRGDAPPEVRIDVPAEGENIDDAIDLKNYPRFVASASDDVGVAAIDFVIERDDDQTTRIPIAKAAGKASPQLSAEIETERIPLTVGQRARAWFEARDARVLPDGAAAPQTSRSRVMTLMRSAEAPLIQPDPAEGASDGNSPSSGSHEMGEEIPGQAKSGGGDHGGKSQAELSEQEPGPGGQRAAADDDAPPDPNSSAQRFIDEHTQELREIGEAMQRRGDDSSAEGDSEGASGEPSDRQGRTGEPGDPTAAPPQADQGSDSPHNAGKNDQKSSADESGASGQGSDKPSQPREEAERGADRQTPDAGKTQDASKQRPDQTGEINDARDASKGDSARDPSSDKQRAVSGDASEKRNDQPDKSEPPADSSQKADGERESPRTEQDQEQSAKNQPDSKQPGDTQPEPSASPSRKKSDQPSGDVDQPTESKPETGEKPAPKAEGSEPAPKSASKDAQDKSDQNQSPPQDKAEAGNDRAQKPPGDSDKSQDDKNSSEQKEGANSKSDSASKSKPVAGQPVDDKPGGSSGDASGDESQTPPDRNSGAQGGESQAPPDPKPGKKGGEKSGSGGADRPGRDDPLAEESELDPTGPEPRPPNDHAPRIDPGGASEARDVLEMLRRRGEIPPEVLSELGWSRAKTTAFANALKRMVNLQRATGPRGTPRTREIDTRVGERRMQPGRGLSERASTRADQDRNRSDRLGKLTPPPDQRISPRLRNLLDAYYRSMAQQRKKRSAEESEMP